MKVVACIKQVPDSLDIMLDNNGGLLQREQAPAILNPFDAYGLEEGLQITEKLGGQLIALTMGPPEAVTVLHEAIAMGAASTIHLCDEALRGSDSHITGRVLAAAIGKIGGVQLVICGKQSIDGDTAQVGPEIAEFLGWPHVAYVKKIRQIDEKSLIVERMVEGGVEVLEVRLPALITVLKDINEPRMPSFRLKIKAKKEQIPQWGLAELQLCPEEVGLAGSPTKVVSSFKAQPRGACRILQGSQEEIIATLLDELEAREI